jgi:DNA-binding GntR family transcriptional regulator
MNLACDHRSLILIYARGVVRWTAPAKRAVRKIDVSPLIESVAKPTLSVERAPRSTLQDFVYRQLCELILNGEIAPGQLITIQYLADVFGVSAMPVREALQRLTAARVLTVISSRSIGIPPLARERLSDLRRVRLEVESLAAVWATPNIGEQDVAELQSHVAGMEEAARIGDNKQYLRGNRAFHFKIYQAARSDALYAIIETLWLQISPYFHMLRASGNYFKANEQHEIMLSALRARDEAALSLAVRNDIEAAYLVLVPLLESEKPK